MATSRWSASGRTDAPPQKPSQQNRKPASTVGTVGTAPKRGLLGQVEDAYAKPLDFSGMQTVTAGTGGGRQGVTFSNPFDSRYQRVNFNDPFNPRYQGVDFQRGTQGVNFQRGTQGVDFTSPGMFRGVRGTDFEGIGGRFRLGAPENYGAERASVESAVFDRAMGLLQPQLDRQEQRLQTDLVNRGLAPTSEAYRDLRGQFDDQRQRDLTDLSLASVLAGAQEHQRLADLTSRNRAQLMGEGAQRYSEDMGIRQQEATEAAQRAQQQLGLRGIEAGEAAAIMGNQNQIRGTQAQESANLMNAMLGLRGQQQAGDIARMQGNLGLSGLQREDASARAGQQLGLRQAQRAEDAQRFSQQMALRQQQIAEQRLRRAQPVNDLVSLLAGTTTNPAMPSFAQYSVPAPDYMGAVGSNYNARANAHAANNRGMLGLASAGLGLFSDENIKEDIRRVGTAFNGLSIYSFRYRGEPQTQIGFLAQEVEKVFPEAIGEVAGIKTVDYAKATQGSAINANVRSDLDSLLAVLPDGTLDGEAVEFALREVAKIIARESIVVSAAEFTETVHRESIDVAADILTRISGNQVSPEQIQAHLTGRETEPPAERVVH